MVDALDGVRNSCRHALDLPRLPLAGWHRAVIFCLLVPLVAQAELSDDAWVGPGMRSQPAYDGSSTQRLQFVPVVRYLGDPWFLRSTQDVLETGVRMELAPGLHLGAQVAYEPGRKAQESPFLASHHVPDVDRGASFGGQCEWDHQFGRVPVTVITRLRQHADLARGLQADVRVSAGILRRGRVGAGVYVESIWASARSVDRFYGITPSLSPLTGLPTFVGSAGWLTGVYGIGARLDLSREWVVVAAAESHQLLGAATRSPLVERADNNYFTVGFAYRF